MNLEEKQYIKQKVKKLIMGRTSHITQTLFSGLSEEQIFLMIVKLLGYTICYHFLSPLSFAFFLLFFLSPLLFRRIFPTIYSCLNHILALHLEGYWSFQRYLSHHCFASGGGVGYKMWWHCSGIILTLM